MLRLYQSQSGTRKAYFEICIDAAWALTIANLRTQFSLPIQREEVSFISMASARRSNIKGSKEMMGPLSARVPLRINLFPNSSLEDVMRDINNDFTSMIGFEHCAMKALHTNGGLQNLPAQAVFSWNPPGSDLSSKRIICYDKGVAPAILAYREDLSMPYAHDYGLLFEVYEHEGHVAMFASWDHDLVSTDLIYRLVEGFERFLTLITKTKGFTVGTALCERRAALGWVGDCNS